MKKNTPVETPAEKDTLTPKQQLQQKGEHCSSSKSFE